MPRRLISSGSRFEAEVGYSRAVVDDDWIFVSGTTGFDYAKMTISDDVVVQCEQAMHNIDTALRQADASMADIVRVNYILPRREDRAVLAGAQEALRRHQTGLDHDRGRTGGPAHEDRRSKSRRVGAKFVHLEPVPG